MNQLVEDINVDRLDAQTEPRFDPDGGVLENLARRATAGRGSGIISAANDDDTAANRIHTGGTTQGARLRA